MLRKENEHDRYEFINMVIGEGSEEMLRDILKDNELYDKLIDQENEEFEDIMAKKLSELTEEEMNELAKKYKWDLVVYKL